MLHLPPSTLRTTFQTILQNAGQTVQRIFLLLIVCTGSCWLLEIALPVARADGPRDNQPDQVRRIPGPGIEVPAEQRQALETSLLRLAGQLEFLRSKDEPRVRELLPDVQIFHDAVHDALKYDEFFSPNDINAALQLLEFGHDRGNRLRRGQAPWTEQTGLVVRGYVSKIDGSVQPYGLVVPDSYTNRTPHRYRLDLWFHGRGETLSEVNFLAQRMGQAGQFAPADTIVLHPYGRYSNAFKFAGEVDVLEALDSVRSRYRVDEDRTSVRGFSMGGAACWQFAVHYADRWFAANPGAGFSETPQFLEFFQKETLSPTWYERKLWQLYDCNLWAGNLVHCPTVAYSGEDDIQKQAADVMERAMAEHHLQLMHIIGPKTGHRYHPDAARTVTQLLDSIAEKGRERMPRDVSLTTYTLKYNRMHWVTIDGLDEHWTRARLDAHLVNDRQVELSSENVSALTLEMPAGWAPLSLTAPIRIVADGQAVGEVRAWSDRSWRAQLRRVDGKWTLSGASGDHDVSGASGEHGASGTSGTSGASGANEAGAAAGASLRKRHDLQGPIDDALMDSFIFVRPTGAAWNEAAGKWSAAELERAIEHWRRHFRGHARVKDDSEISPQDIASANLILWGDPGSNQLLGRIAKRLPIEWHKDRIVAGDRIFPADQHALIAIYPNPLNPQRYVVLNSSFTFREYAYLNNARQVPMLPDWAVVDLCTPPNSVWPGKIVDADFFDESWQLKPPHADGP